MCDLEIGHQYLPDWVSQTVGVINIRIMKGGIDGCECEKPAYLSCKTNHALAPWVKIQY